MPDRITVSDELFLGRVDEQQRFRVVLDELLSHPDRSLLSGRRTTTPSWSHVVLLYGRGGMGKTTLCKRLRDIASGLGSDRQYRGKFRSIWLDWEVRRDRDLRLAAREAITFEMLLEHVCSACGEAGFQNASPRLDVVISRLRALENSVDQMLSDEPEEGVDQYAALRRFGSIGIAQFLKTHAQSIADAVPQEVLVESVSEVLRIGGDALGLLRKQAAEWLQKRLNADEYKLFTNPNESLARAFAEDLRNAARAKPLIIFFDTYEIVDVLDSWLRLLMSCSGDQVMWVVSGRDNLVESRAYGGSYFLGYQGEVPTDRFRAFPLSEFNQADIMAYFEVKVPGRPLSSVQAIEIQHATFGIPLAVKTAAAIWARGIALEEITKGLSQRTSRDEVIKTMTERFLMHAHADSEHPSDIGYLYSLAVMYQPDFDILAALWNLDDVRPVLDNLERRYDFVFAYKMHMHETVRDYIREYLLAPVERQRPALIASTRRAVSLLESRLKTTAQEAVTLEARAQNDKWVDNVLALTWYRLWTNIEAGWKTFEIALLVALAYDHKLARVLLKQASFFLPSLSQMHIRQLKSWISLAAEGSAADDGVLVNALKQSLTGDETQPNDGCATESAAIVAWLRGRVARLTAHERLSVDFFLDAAHQVPADSSILRRFLRNELMAAGDALTESDVNDDIALIAYEQAAILDASSAHPWHALGHAYEKRGSLEKAIAAYRKSSEVSPSLSRNWSCLGRIYRRLDQFEEAAYALQRAIECESKETFRAGYLEALSEIHFKNGRLREAVSALEEATSLDPTRSSAWLGLGMNYSSQGKVDDAIRSFRKAAKSGNSKVKAAALCEIGDLLKQQGKNTQAATMYARACSTNPNYDRAHHALGHICQETSKLEEAISHFEQAHLLNPQRPDHLSCLARACLEFGRLEDAVNYFMLSIECDKDDDRRASLWHQLSHVYAKLKRTDEAVTALEQALTLNGKQAIYWLSLGDLHRGSNHTSDAVGAYRKAIELASEDGNRRISAKRLASIQSFIERDGT